MADAQTELKAVDIQSILTLLPHRYPMLLVDKIIEIDGNQRAIGIKNVTMNEPHFTTYPGKLFECPSHASVAALVILPFLNILLL